MLEVAVPPRMCGAPPSNARDPRGALVVAILGSSMAFLDGTIVNVALPVMQRQLGISVALAQWVVEAYSLFLASLVLVGGALGDRLGRRRVFSAGVVIFAIASMACGLAHGAVPCIVARAVQGVGAALLVPGSLSLISAAYGESGRGAAIGTWSAFTTAVMGSVEAQHAGVASGVNNAVARAAGLLAVAALGLVVVAGFNRELDGELATMSLPDSVAKIVAAERGKLVAADFSDIGDGPLRTALGVAFARGYVAGFRASMLVCAGLAALGAACAFWMVESKSRSDPSGRLWSGKLDERIYVAPSHVREPER
jgi:MFS family permease